MRGARPSEQSDPGFGPRPGRGRLRGRARLPLVAVGAVVLVTVLIASAATPPRAQAAIPIIGGPINSLVGSIAGGITGGIAKLAVGAFDAIIKALFAPIAKFITTQLIGWLVAVPSLTQGNVWTLEQTVEAMGGGVLGAVATISVIRYWAAGFSGGGNSGFAALEGLIRTIGAALFLAAWPWLFDQAVNLTNLFTSSLMGSGAVVHDVSHLLAAGLGASVLSMPVLGLFLMIAMAVAGSLLFLGLLLLKIVVSISTILVFVGMPLAVVAWPVVPWVGRLAMRAFAVCLVVPVLWALCFAASAAVGLNAATFNASGLADTLLQPLVAIVLLYVMLRLPTHLARVAMLGAAPLGGGFTSRAVSYAAGSQMRQVAQQHLPGWAGGHSPQNKSEGESRTGSRLRNAATLAGVAATGGTAAAAAAPARAGTAAAGSAAGSTAAGAGAGNGAGKTAGPANGRAYTPPPTAQANASGRPLQNGLQTPAFAGREQDFADEKFESEHRAATSPVSAEQAKAALTSLPADTQRGVGKLVSDHGAGAREHLAYQAMGEWSPEQREALRTLAAATPEVRGQATKDAVGDVRQPSPATDAAARHGADPGGVVEPPAPGGGGDPGSRPGGGAVEGAPYETGVDDPGVPLARPGSEAPTPRTPPSPTPPTPAAPSGGQPSTPAPDEALPRRNPPAPREPRGPSPEDLFRD